MPRMPAQPSQPSWWPVKAGRMCAKDDRSEKGLVPAATHECATCHGDAELHAHDDAMHGRGPAGDDRRRKPKTARSVAASKTSRGSASTTFGLATEPSSATVNSVTTHPSMPRASNRGGYFGAGAASGAGARAAIHQPAVAAPQTGAITTLSLPVLEEHHGAPDVLAARRSTGAVGSQQAERHAAPVAGIHVRLNLEHEGGKPQFPHGHLALRRGARARRCCFHAGGGGDMHGGVDAGERAALGTAVWCIFAATVRRPRLDQGSLAVANDGGGFSLA